jgi:membrane protein DedA with SNARE-associated domain
MLFLLLFFSTLASEDLACVSAGALIAGGQLTFFRGALACAGGIFLGDLLLFFAGRTAGVAFLNSSWVHRNLSESRVRQASELLNRRGAAAVLFSRFLPGTRLPTYFAAGALGNNTRAFLLYFAVAASIWAPLLVWISATGGLVASKYGLIATAAVSLIVLLACQSLVKFLANHNQRRRLVGKLGRLLHPEFWPSWLLYLPIVPWIAILALRYRGLTLPAVCNPGIHLSGIQDESKSEILARFAAQTRHFARFRLIPFSLGDERVECLRQFMIDEQLDFPVVLKPDAGERGQGVEVIRSFDEAANYFRNMGQDTILQQYVPGQEYGVFYYRFPGAHRGTISSITRKLFPRITGDGHSTLEELILNGARSVYLAPQYLAQLHADRNLILSQGESFQLIEIGSHSRGAIFEDATDLKTARLAESLDRALQDFPGFYFGRFDLRTRTVEALQRGEFTILELNGLTSEPTHIYDPRTSFTAIYHALFHHWHVAFRIGAANRKRGARVPALMEIWSELRA